MARIVLKFGGTSVGDIDRIRNAARKVKAEVDRGNQVAVVASAMSGATNQLVKWVNEIAPLHDAREYDVVVATGEQVTIGLLAMALQQQGVKARSWMSWQIPIRTDAAHSQGAHRRHRDRRHGTRHGGGRGADRAGLPGPVAGRPRDDAGPRRLRHLGGGAGGGAQGRPLRHLHRRRRRLHDRSQDRREGAQDRPGDLRGNARNGVAGLQGAADALGRAGDESSRARAGAIVVRRRTRQRSARHDGCGRGRDHGPGAREIRRERHRLLQGRGQDHGDPRARPAGRGGGDLRPAGRQPTSTST